MTTTDNAAQATAGGDESWRGKIGALDPDELDAFLAGGVIGRLAVLDDDGWPYVVPVWFEWRPDEGIFWIIPRKRSAWAGYMQRDGRVAMTIDDEGAPYRKVAVQGTVVVVEEPNIGGQWVEIARRMSVRYLGPHGPDYLEPTLDKPRWLFKLTPKMLTTWQGVEWAQRYKE